MKIFDSDSIEELYKEKQLITNEKNSIKPKVNNEKYVSQMMNAWELLYNALNQLPSLAKKLDKQPKNVANSFYLVETFSIYSEEYSFEVNNIKNKIIDNSKFFYKYKCNYTIIRSKNLYGPLFKIRDGKIYVDKHGNAIIVREKYVKKDYKLNAKKYSRTFETLNVQTVKSVCSEFIDSRLSVESIEHTIGCAYLNQLLFFASFDYRVTDVEAGLIEITRFLSLEEQKDIIKGFIKKYLLA